MRLNQKLSEKQLLMEFFKFWTKNYPDVITGLNTKFFDLPYLMNRICHIVDEKVIKRFSPWNLVERESIVVRGRPQTVYQLFGICMLDYLDLYKWFIPTRQESYKLDFIGELELGRGKDDNGYDTFKEWYTKDFQSFVDYNIQDVEIVDALEDKLGLIDLSLTVAYDSKVNYDDIFSQVRVWDTLIANHLMQKNICVPPREEHSKETKYEGAYVKEPKPGLYKWVYDLDLTSLYPSIIMQYNMSPETILNGEVSNIDIENMLATGEAVQSPNGKAIAANGQHFSTKKIGIIPMIIDEMYNERVGIKQEMISA